MDDFLRLPEPDRKRALTVAATISGRPAHLLEKDVWVVWCLRALFESAIAGDLVFKGGTSLSKVYDVIHRFSEDVDLTYSIRAMVPDLAGGVGGQEALPRTRSEEKRWSGEIRRRLPVWVAEHALPIVQKRLVEDGVPAQATAARCNILVDYKPLAVGTSYSPPTVKLEFGARSTGEPSAVHDVSCDADGLVQGASFPRARPKVMRAERTFWEKATAAHVFCLQGRLRSERFSRHWHDLARLDAAGIAAAAIADEALATAVADHKGMFFPEKDAARHPVSYHAAVQGGIRLVPESEARAALAKDYEDMSVEGLLFEEAEPFDVLMERCAALAAKINRVGSA